MLQFDDSIIAKNIAVATEYFKAYYPIAYREKKFSGGTTGFIPFNIEFTIDGLSGIKIYNKLRIDTSFLPAGYTKTIDFIVTGIDHKLKDGDWETVIKTTMIPKLESTEVVVTTANFKATTYPPPIKVLTPVQNVVGGNAVGGTGEKSTGTLGTNPSSTNPDRLDSATIERIVAASGAPTELRKRILKVALSYVGQTELPGDNQGWYDARFENKMSSAKAMYGISSWSPGNSWCNYFTNLCWAEAYNGGNEYVPVGNNQSIWDTKIKNKGVLSGRCFDTLTGLTGIGNGFTTAQVIAGTYTPLPGDMAIYNSSHIEMVCAAKYDASGKITGVSTVGGNTGAIDINDGGATKYKTNVKLSEIKGFGQVVES